MVNRFFERKVEIDFNEDCRRKGNVMELQYYLLESENEEVNDMKKDYGIEIVKKHNGVSDESRQFINIFNDRKKTERLLKVLAENTVTPSSLPYILDDIIGI